MSILLSTITNEVNPLQLVKSWVNFNGDTNTIRSSYNVSSVTRPSGGNFTINFTTALSNANYAVTATGEDLPTSGAVFFSGAGLSNTAASAKIRCVDTSGVVVNPATAMVIICAT